MKMLIKYIRMSDNRTIIIVPTKVGLDYVKTAELKAEAIKPLVLTETKEKINDNELLAYKCTLPANVKFHRADSDFVKNIFHAYWFTENSVKYFLRIPLFVL